jgi:hypothetical protein
MCLANRLAAAPAPFCAAGQNLLLAAFLDPCVHDIHPTWKETGASMVAPLPATIGPETDDARLNELIGELLVRSELFRERETRR